jgi:hypothetical protein
MGRRSAPASREIGSFRKIAAEQWGGRRGTLWAPRGSPWSRPLSPDPEGTGGRRAGQGAYPNRGEFASSGNTSAALQNQQLTMGERK